MATYAEPLTGSSLPIGGGPTSGTTSMMAQTSSSTLSGLGGGASSSGATIGTTGMAQSSSMTAPTTTTTPGSSTTPGGSTIPSSSTAKVEPVLLVTGATGTTGYEVLQVLSNEYRNRFQVIAGVHGSRERSESILSKVDVLRRIDADDLRALDFSGVDLLFIIPSNSENRVEQVKNYVNAARRDGVRYILLLSVILSEARDNLFARQFHDMERYVSDSGIPCTFLRCTFFQQNLFAHAEEIRELGIISLPIGRGKCAPLHVLDIARAASAILCNPNMHIRKAYDLVGPELLDGNGIAEAASRSLRTRVQFIDCSKEEFLELYQRQGVPGWLASGFAEILELVAANRLANIETRSFFMELTGHEPIRLEEFFTENYHRFSREGEGRRGKYYEKRGPVERYEEGPRERVHGISKSPLDELIFLLQELVADKHRRVKSKREWLRKEQASLDRMMDLYDRFEQATIQYGERELGGRTQGRPEYVESERYPTGYYQERMVERDPGYGRRSEYREVRPQRYYSAGDYY